MVLIQQYPSLIPGEQRALYTKKSKKKVTDKDIRYLLYWTTPKDAAEVTQSITVLPATTKRPLVKAGWRQLPFSGVSFSWTCWVQPQLDSQDPSLPFLQELQEASPAPLRAPVLPQPGDTGRAHVRWGWVSITHCFPYRWHPPTPWRNSKQTRKSFFFKIR